jgi:DNA-binding transcriptional MocR family regulator
MFGSQLLQRALADFLERKKFKPHLRRVVPIYKQRRDVLLRTLVEWMPDYVRWTQPEGGFTCWLSLPNDSRLHDLYHTALERGLAYSPGSVFMTEPDGQQHLRLCFGNLPEETIREGVILLSELIRERIGERVQPRQPTLNRVPLV